ncbi:MAG: hypothetical protein JSW50_15280 [Candidatus Latescibacterota bacterium]|nr:MAG: hypothetical protein JSW50_15280 [Candidatus Latescibacterota bacterium]
MVGNGSFDVNASSVGVDLDDDGTPDSELVSNYQKDFDTRFESPLSIAAGAAYRFKLSAVLVSAVWFDRVDEFAVMNPANFRGQTIGETFEPSVRAQFKSVFNWGVGLEHTFSKKLGFYGSYRLDRSAFDPDAGLPIRIHSGEFG